MESKEPYHIILNPIAGRGAGAQARQPIEEAFQARGLSYTLSQTERPGQAIKLAREAVQEGAATLVAVGGDGTANEVLNGLVQATLDREGEAAMGILAVGSGNDFAFGAGIPTELSAGLETLFQQKPRAMDVGLVFGGDYPQGRYFGNGVGIGFDAVVGFEAAKITRVRGFLSYLIAALRTIFLYYQAPRIQLETDDGAVTLSALMVSVMNGRRMGGGFLMAPGARTDDGLLSLCIAEQVSKLGILRLIPHFLRGSQFSQKSIRGAETTRVRVLALDGHLPVHADGETICTAGRELRIELPDLSIPIIRAGEDDAA
jgi:YegS/Rv2252/BmrU family lipid kinase